MNTSKIRDLLEARLSKIQYELWDQLKPKDWAGDFEQKLEVAWCEYLNGIDCTVLCQEDVRCDFESIINHSAKGRVCVNIQDETSTSDSDIAYVLMPIKLAEKALVLGSLPDSWFPEKDEL